MLARVVPSLVAVMVLVAVVLIATAPAAASGAPGHGGESGDSPPDLDPLEWKSDLAIFTGVLFVILFVVLSKFAWGPIASGLDKREQRIADEIAAAEKSNSDARQLLGQYDEKLAGAKDEVRQIIDSARRDAEQLGREMLDKARTDAAAEAERARQDIETATGAALEQLAIRGADLAVDLAGKILRAQIDATAHKQLIQQAVSDFPQGDADTN